MGWFRVLTRECSLGTSFLTTPQAPEQVGRPVARSRGQENALSLLPSSVSFCHNMHGEVSLTASQRLLCEFAEPEGDRTSLRPPRLRDLIPKLEHSSQPIVPQSLALFARSARCSSPSARSSDIFVYSALQGSGRQASCFQREWRIDQRPRELPAWPGRFDWPHHSRRNPSIQR